MQYEAKGAFTYNLGSPNRDAIVGHDGTHGFKELPQVAFLEGEFTDRGDLDLKTLQSIEDATITLELANGKNILFRNAWYASEGNVQTEEANIAVRFECMSAEEIS